jgi:hypothetical protein
VQDIIREVSPQYPSETQLSAPAYNPPADVASRPRIMLAVPSLARHMSSEGHELQQGMQAAGWKLHGHELGLGTDVKEIIEKENPAVVLVTDSHEWDSGHLAVKEEKFHNVEALAKRPDIFVLTTVKDSHRQYESAKSYAANMGCHAIITYYNPSIVCRMSNWIRPQHVIRTWHTVDANKVPEFNTKRYNECLLSGSLGGAYPLRERIHKSGLSNVTWLRHPGYVNTGSSTASYLQTLSQYKVAICTSSRFGYCLRKVMEAAACGCRVVTDLPVDDVVPEIDFWIVRIAPDIHMSDLRLQLQQLCDEWNPDQQTIMAARARSRFDYNAEGKRLAMQIEQMRKEYK